MERAYKLRGNFSEALSGLDFVLPEITLDFKKDIVMPYYNAPFGREENGIFESLFCSDKAANPKAQKAVQIKRILDELGLEPVRWGVTILRGGEVIPCTYYGLPYYDPKCSIFKPTVNHPLQRASNLYSEVDIEVLLTFEDGYVLPVVKTVQTGGDYATSSASIFQDFLSDLYAYDPQSFFEGSNAAENITVREDGSFALMVCSPTRMDTTLEFGSEPYELEDLRRAVSSVRIIDIRETVNYS